jgi:site-specific DNA-cytosine methylase
MFDDMVCSQLQDDYKPMLEAMTSTFRDRPLRVATMCSGTESPLLALDMLSKAIEDQNGKEGLAVEHVFSCEIEPYKQAYIERNFSPPVLFRDIRELGNDQACTAYGSLADVPNTPGCVDMLVAGTSCVDYSNLNNEKVRFFSVS